MIKTKSFRPTKLELYKVSMVNYFKSDFWYLVLIWVVAIFFMIRRSDNLFNICFFAFAILYPIFIAVKYWIQFSSNDFKKDLIERYYEIDENSISIKYEDGRTTSLEISGFLKYIPQLARTFSVRALQAFANENSEISRMQVAAARPQ